ARAHCDEAVRMLRHALGDLHPLVAEAESNFAVAIAVTGDLRGARAHWEAALATLEHGLGDSAPGLATVLLDLEDVARETGDFAAADGYLARALAVVGDNLDVRIRVAGHLRTTGKSDDAIAMLDDIARRAEATLGQNHPTTAHALEELGVTYYEVSRYADARAAWQKNLAISTTLYGANHPTTLGLAGRLGQAMMEMHDGAAARPLFEHAMLVLEAGPADSPF